MAYTLIRECKLVLVYNGVGYHLDALSDFQFSQTFSRKSSLRKTLHSKVARPLSISNSKNPASFSMRVLATDSYVEGVFLEIVGMQFDGNKSFSYPYMLNVLANNCEMFIISENEIYKIENSMINNVDTSLALNSALGFDISITASDILKVTDAPSTTKVQGSPVTPSPIFFYINDELINNVINASISIQQVINWRADKGLHDIGSIYTPRVGMLTEMSLTASVTTHLNSKITIQDDPFVANVKIQQSSIIYDLQNVLINKRLTPEDVFQESFDIALTEESDNVVVEYGGL